MGRTVLGIALVLALSSCGKNDGFNAVKPAPTPAPITNTYPKNPNGQYPYGNGQYPYGGGGYGGYTGGYGGQMPSGMPQQYAPFMPIDNYMRQQYPQQWQNHWNGWQNYAQRYGYSPYDFNRFWYVYTPTVWVVAPYVQIYQTFSTQVYYH